MKKFIVVFGTRPEIIKLAPVIREIQKSGHQTQVVHTGQHQDMAASLIEFFDLKVDVNLSLMAKSKGLSDLYSRVMQGLDESADKKADGIFVQGDTTSCAAAASWGFLNRIPVYHVEAGLRTHDLMSPWPEEYNRRITTLSAALHFCPTEVSAENLLKEGIAKDHIRVVGNTVIDALMWTAKQTADQLQSVQTRMAKLLPLLGNRKLVLATVHRRESFGEPIREIFRALRRLAEQENVLVLLPLHKNPMVVAAAQEIFGDIKTRGFEAGSAEVQAGKVQLLEPLDYPDFVFLMKSSQLILSDSGGVQEEAPALGKSVLVLRETSERPEALSTGLCRLVGHNEEKIIGAAQAILKTNSQLEAQFPYGNGRSAAAILQAVLRSNP